MFTRKPTQKASGLKILYCCQRCSSVVFTFSLNQFNSNLTALFKRNHEICSFSDEHFFSGLMLYSNSTLPTSHLTCYVLFLQCSMWLIYFSDCSLFLSHTSFILFGLMYGGIQQINIC